MTPGEGASASGELGQADAALRTHSGRLRLYRELIGDDALLGELSRPRGAADYSPGEFTATTEEIAELAERTATFVAGARSRVVERLEAGADEPDPPPDL